MRDGCMISAAFAIIAVAIMVSMPISVGYASAGYTATTVCSNNSVSSSYFTVGLYSCTSEVDRTFTPTGTMLRSMDLELKRIDGTQYQVFGSPILTPGNLFLKVTEFSDDTYQYTADAEGSTVTYTDGTGTHEVQGVTFTVVVSELHLDGSDPYYVTVNTFDPGTEYKVNIVANFSNQSIVPGTNVGGQIQCDLDFSINLAVHRVVSNGIFAQSNAYTAILNEHTESQSVIEQNGGGVVSGGDGDSHTYYLSDATGNYNNGCQAVNISNEGNSGIMSRGKANVSIVMPVGTKFVINFREAGGGNKNRLNINIYNADSEGHAVGDPIYSTSGDGLSIKNPKYIIRNGNNIELGGTTAPTNDNNWFIVTSSYGVVIKFTSKDGNNPSADNCVVDIVIKPPTP